MREKIRLYFSFAKIAIRAVMMHRGAFFAGVVGQWLLYGSTFLTIYLMVVNFENMGGWSAAQVVFLYGFNLLAYGLAAAVFFRPCKYLIQKIRTGEFDGAMTKPINPLVFEVYMGFNPGHISHILLGLATMIYTADDAGFRVCGGNILLFVVMLSGAVLMKSALLIFPSAGSIFFIKTNPIYLLIEAGEEFVKYPITIYHGAIQLILTVVLPFAFVSYYPVSTLLEGEMHGILPAWVGYLSPLVGAGMFAFSIWAWNKSMEKYQSTGN